MAGMALCWDVSLPPAERQPSFQAFHTSPVQASTIAAGVKPLHLTLPARYKEAQTKSAIRRVMGSRTSPKWR